MHQKIINHIQKSLSRSQSRGPFFESLDFGIEKFGLGKKVSVSVSENLVSDKKSRYRSWKIWSRRKILAISIGQNLGLVTQ